MKKRKTILTAIIAGSIIAACQKSDFSAVKDKKQNSNADLILIDNFKQNNADYQLNLCLYDATKALMQLSSDAQAMQIIYDYAIQNQEHQISFTELILAYPQAKKVIDNYLLLNAVGNYKNLEGLTKKMVYEKVDYFPLIRIPEINKHDLTLSPVFAAGIEINNDNAIMSWSSENQYQQIKALHEQEAQNSSNPVLLVVNATDYVVVEDDNHQNQSSQFSKGETPVYDKTSFAFGMTSGRINNGYRYEGGSSPSELFFHITRHSDSPLVGVKASPFNHAVGIYNFSSTQVNSSTFVSGINKLFVTADFTSYPRLWVTAYEYDWYAGEKTITSHSNALKHTVSMKYSNEWYYLVGDIYEGTTSGSGPGSYASFTNYKCRLDIYKVY